MRVGVGLPNAVPGTEASVLLEWARRADAGPFTSLGVLDRVAYDCHEPMALLAAVAGVTQRTTLVTMVVIAPLRSTALLAKQAAFVDALSGGRLVLGLAIGARTSDYDAAGVDHRDRGRRFERQLAELRDLWESGPGPRPAEPRGPVVLVGGGGYAEAGCDELVLLPAVADLDQLDLLADVVAEARLPEGVS